jgi:hypothetical protein
MTRASLTFRTRSTCASSRVISRILPPVIRRVRGCCASWTSRSGARFHPGTILFCLFHYFCRALNAKGFPPRYDINSEGWPPPSAAMFETKHLSPWTRILVADRSADEAQAVYIAPRRACVPHRTCPPAPARSQRTTNNSSKSTTNNSSNYIEVHH